jgi:hypothetical protein
MPIRALPNGRPIPPHSPVAIDRNQWSSSTETGVAIDRNQWSSSTETGGRHRPEPVVVIDRNRWSSSIETTGRLQPKQLVVISRCAQLSVSDAVAINIEVEAIKQFGHRLTYLADIAAG